MLLLQVNDSAVSLRLVIFGSLYTDYRTDGSGEGREERDVTPLTCCDWLTVIWSGVLLGKLSTSQFRT
jgi:hypothetical protein